jgi:putative phosphoribosyl transferase
MATTSRDVSIPIDGIRLTGALATPWRAAGLVIFAHGGGSSRLSPRNRHVAAALRERGLATLLFDLLAPDEDLDETARFDIPALAARLVAVTDLMMRDPSVPRPFVYFGASTGAAAALVAAARRPDEIVAVVSRGGRPDLAGGAIFEVRAPTLFIVGGADTRIIEVNGEAAARMVAPHAVAVVRGATHLFEEPGALDEVARLAGTWFLDELNAYERNHRDEVRV